MDKNVNLLTRIIITSIFGTISFGLLFTIFIGGGNMDNMDNMANMNNMNSYGTGSLGNVLGGLLFLLVKLLIVVLVIAIIIGVVMWLKNTFFKDSNNQFMMTINNDPILKMISVITLSIVGILVIFGLLGSITGTGMGANGTMGGLTSAFSIASILILLTNVLSFVLVISLILAIVAYVKKQYDTGAFNSLNSSQEKSSAQQDNKNDEL